MLQFMGSQRVGHDLATEQQQQNSIYICHILQAPLVLLHPSYCSSLLLGLPYLQPTLTQKGALLSTSGFGPVLCSNSSISHSTLPKGNIKAPLSRLSGSYPPCIPTLSSILPSVVSSLTRMVNRTLPRSNELLLPRISVPQVCQISPGLSKIHK